MKHAITILSLSTLLAACSAPTYDQDESNSNNQDVIGDPNLGNNNDASNDIGAEDRSAQLLTNWTNNVSQGITQSYCIVCHSDSSIARDTNWVLLANNQDDYLNTNLTRTLAYIEADEANAQLLIEKAQGINHGGGQVLQAESASANNWSAFMELATTETVTNPDVPNNGNGSNTNPTESRQAAIDYYVTNLENNLVQSDCYVCHQANGVAKNSDIIFVGSNVNDYDVFNANMVIDYARTSESNLNNFLLKPIGQNHAGNKIIDITSNEAQHISAFLALVEDIEDAPEVTVNTPTNTQASVLLNEVFFVWEMTGDHDSFEIERKEGSGQWTVIATPTKDTSLHRDDTVSENEDYQYRIRAKFGNEYSNYSNPVSVSIN